MGVVGSKTKQRLAAVTVDDDVFDAPEAADDAPRELQRVGRFPLIRRLGAGGMGAVYAAYDEILDRKIALKLMHPQRGGSIGQKQRTLVEARALARVTHPCVVTVYEVGEADGHIYISMEYIEGTTLSDWCAEAPRSWRQVLDMYLQAGDGLAAAHQVGIVHRDFKPDNVLVGKDGRPRVVDFGLARLGGQSAASIELPSALSGEHQHASRPDDDAAGQPALDEPDQTTPAAPSPTGPAHTKTSASIVNQPGSLRNGQVTRAGSISGTPGYMSPEQYIGGDVGALSDQFSFCAALFEALYGFLPFSGETIEQLAAAVNGPVRSPPPASKVPVEVHRALLRGLSVDPQGRFSTMDALLAALRIEHGHSSAGGALSRRRVIRTIGTISLLVMAMLSLRVVQRAMSARDAALASVVLLAVFLGVGQLQREIFLSNQFHRRLYLVITLGVSQNLLQRVVAARAGWLMKQLFPLEMVVWSGVCVALIYLGLRSLRLLLPVLLGMGALATFWPDIPKPMIMGTYLIMVLSVAIAWLRAGQKQAGPNSSPKPTGKR